MILHRFRFGGVAPLLLLMKTASVCIRLEFGKSLGILKDIMQRNQVCLIVKVRCLLASADRSIILWTPKRKQVKRLLGDRFA
jgi:hypothetical protein